MKTLGRELHLLVLWVTAVLFFVFGHGWIAQARGALRSQTFLAVLIPLASFALILPNFTTSTQGPTLSNAQAIVIGLLTLTLYGVFLSMQTMRHRGFFIEPGEEAWRTSPDETHASKGRGRAIAFHATALLLTLVPVVYLAEELSQIVRYGIAAIGAPRSVAGVLIAVLVLAPESMGALRAALADRPQRAINITLGSALATIGLTIPAVLAVGVATGTPVALGLQAEEMVLLAVTFVVSMITFAGARTNVLLGAVHAVMFLVFVLLLFDP